MKKIAFITMMLFFACAGVNMNADTMAFTSNNSVNSVARNPLDGHDMVGEIGGASSQLRMWNNLSSYCGYYEYLNMTRNVKFSSYNAKTGTLVLSAYQQGSGKYIGKFVGKVSYSYNCPSYRGTFTNYKGAKVRFYFEAICD